MVAAGLLFSAMGAAIKLASRDLPNAMVVFFRNAVGLAMLLPWLLPGGREGLRTRDVRGHLVRGLSGLAAMYCFFYAIAHLRLADAVLLNQSVPLFLPMVGRVWLGEKVPPGLWRVLALGFAGLLLVLKPGSELFALASLVGLASAMLGAVAQVGIRRLTRTEPVERIVFYFALIGSLGGAPAALAAWRPITGGMWIVLLAMGFFATLGQLSMTRAYAHAPAAVVGPFLFAGPIFAGLFDWWIWGVLPDRLFVLGALLVAVAAVLTLRGEARGPARESPLD
jgi:drug/metabolite transporter (DMT)-like permease